MLEKLINASTDYLIRCQVIDEDDKDVYIYGFHALYNNIIDIFSIIVISICLSQIPQTIIYHISFILLRFTAGGFHAQTRLHCFFLSTTIWIISLWGISWTPQIIYIALAGLSTLFIWMKAPIENDNSPLNIDKYQFMKALCRKISVVLFAGVLLMAILVPDEYDWVAASLAYGMGSHSILILASILQKNIQKIR